MFRKCGLRVVSLLAGILLLPSSYVQGGMVNFAEVALSSTGFTYFTSDGLGLGEFGYSASGNFLITLQTDTGVAGAVVTSVVASQDLLGSDDSGDGGNTPDEVNGVLANDDGSGGLHTLTFEGWFYNGGTPAYSDSLNPQTLMIAQATGPGQILEVPGSLDDVQVQYQMQIIGGGLEDGSAGHSMFSTFDVTHAFHPSLSGGAANPVDLSADLSFLAGGDSVILINPEPMTIMLLGLGGLGLSRRRKA